MAPRRTAASARIADPRSDRRRGPPAEGRPRRELDLRRRDLSRIVAPVLLHKQRAAVNTAVKCVATWYQVVCMMPRHTPDTCVVVAFMGWCLHRTCSHHRSHLPRCERRREYTLNE